MTEDRPHFARVGDQARFFKPRPDDQPLNHLFQYEQLDQAVAFFENRLGRQIELPHKNVSPKADLPVSDEIMTRSNHTLRINLRCGSRHTVNEIAAAQFP